MGTTDLAIHNKDARLAKPAPEFSNEQIRLLGETVAKGCDQDELAFFLQVAKLKRLDPFTGQIHVVKRWDSQAGKEKITIQTGVDGYRVIASRTGELAGIDDPEYDAEEEEHPKWAKVTVYRYGRGNEKVPYRATARWSEYVQMKKDGNPNSMWKKMPYLMLGKVSESLALRKAFPDELSGMYTNEEMDQADNESHGVSPDSVFGKPQVAMPRSTDEKKPEAVKAQTATQGQQTQQQASQVQQQASLVKVEGEIQDVRKGSGKAEGALFLIVSGKVVEIPKDLVIADMVSGAKILAMATKTSQGDRGDMYWAKKVEMVVPPVQEAEIVDAEFTDTAVDGPDPVLEEARSAGLSGIFEDAPPKDKVEEKPAAAVATTNTSAAKPGTIGSRRAQRLYAIRGQNAKNTGLNEETFKKILLALPHPIEHLRDLEIGMYEEFEKICTGEEDFKGYLE